jgi:hypothetical protein
MPFHERKVPGVPFPFAKAEKRLKKLKTRKFSNSDTRTAENAFWRAQQQLGRRPPQANYTGLQHLQQAQNQV